MSLLYIIAVNAGSGTISGTVGTLINAVSIDDYGAVGNGTTDDTAALAAAIATGSHVFIPKNKTYRIVGTDGGGVSGLFAATKLNAGQMLIGEDRLTSVIKVTGNGRGVQVGNNCVVSNLKFTGDSGAFNAGLALYGTGFILDGLTFTGFTGDNSANGGGGIFGIGWNALTNWMDGSTISNIDLISNTTGLNLPARCEYVNITNVRALRNTTGIVVRAGNTKLSNIQASGNTTGVAILSGTNDGHGVISNSTLNHNTTNLQIDGLTLGFKLVGVMMYAGNVTISSSERVIFVGCDFEDGTTTLTANVTPKLVGCVNENTVNVVSGNPFTEV